jgi:hypothetical protein
MLSTAKRTGAVRARAACITASQRSWTRSRRSAGWTAHSGASTRCGVGADGHTVFSDEYLADLYPDRRGVGVHLDITCGNVVGGDGKSNGDHQEADRTINASVARKAQQYAPFNDKLVKTLTMNSGGRISPDFHEVLYAFARRMASRVLGVEGGIAGDAGGETRTAWSNATVHRA